MANTIAVAISPACHGGTLSGVDLSMFSLRFDAGQDGWDVADDPMLVELIALLHVTRIAAASAMVLASPRRIDATSSEDERPRCLHPGTAVGHRMWMDRYQVVLGMARYAPCSLSSKPSSGLQQPLITSPPRLRITEDPKVAGDSDFVPKRSARLAAKSKFRAAKPDAQARKVLMKKLGLKVETEKPDETSFEEFQQVVATTPLHVTREATEALFPFRGRIRGLVSADE
jgi:hypothetical protein